MTKKKTTKLPKDFGKIKTSKELFAEWIKTIPKGTPMRNYQTKDMFMIVVDSPNFAFTYKVDDSK